MRCKSFCFIICSLMMIAGIIPTVTTECEISMAKGIGPLSSENYTFYWIIGQLPEQTNVYLYVK